MGEVRLEHVRKVYNNGHVAVAGADFQAADGEQSAASSAQAPTLDDQLDSANIRCTFGPGNGGSWPQGKLTIGDAAWWASRFSID